MKKILIATDGSPSSAEAVQFGVELAENLQSRRLRHAYIQKNAGRRFASRYAQERLPITKLSYLISRVAEHGGECFTHVVVVIDDKDFADHGSIRCSCGTFLSPSSHFSYCMPCAATL